jgi:hypothetical protein
MPLRRLRGSQGLQLSRVGPLPRGGEDAGGHGGRKEARRRCDEIRDIEERATHIVICRRGAVHVIEVPVDRASTERS